MSWNYAKNYRQVIDHEAGTVPPRPLSVGDVVTWPLSGYVDTIYATTATLLMFDGRPHQPQFRKPIEGDDSDCIFAK